MTNEKTKCETEYWMLRCQCERCKNTRDSWIRTYINQIFNQAVLKHIDNNIQKEAKE